MSYPSNIPDHAHPCETAQGTVLPDARRECQGGRSSCRARFRDGIDTFKIAQRTLKSLPSKSLSSLCEYYQIENKAAHRAYYDALATAKLYQTLAHYFENEDPSLFKPQQLTYKIKKVQPATAKQVALLQRLYSQKKKVPEWNPDTITRSEASRLIDSLLKSKVI